MKGGFLRLFHLGCTESEFRLSEKIRGPRFGHCAETGFAGRKGQINQALIADQEIITARSGKARHFINDSRKKFDRISRSTQTCWSKKMNWEENYQEIESSIVVLGAAYAASLIGMIFWVIA